MTASEDGTATDREDGPGRDAAETGLGEPPAEAGRTSATVRDSTARESGGVDTADHEASGVDPHAAPIPNDNGEVSRKRALLYISPFLFLGLADVVLLLGWGLDPLWGFMILPPILFISFLGWIAFKYGFVSDRTDEGYDDVDDTAAGK